MLAMPEVESRLAKLRSPAAEPSGTPSRRSWLPEAPRRMPVSLFSGKAVRSSRQAVSNCAVDRAWPNSYNRANFNRMLRLRTKARAAGALVSALIFFVPELREAIPSRFRVEREGPPYNGMRGLV